MRNHGVTRPAATGHGKRESRGQGITTPGIHTNVRDRRWTLTGDGRDRPKSARLGQNRMVMTVRLRPAHRGAVAVCAMVLFGALRGGGRLHVGLAQYDEPDADRRTASASSP